MSEYTQAVCHDGAAILKDGVPLTIEQILEALRERDEYRNHLAAIAEMTGNAGDIGAAHEGVNAVVEELARHKRLFAETCQQLGSIQEALAAHVERLKAAAISAYEACDEQQESDEFSRCVIIRDAVWSKLELLNQLATDDEDDYTASLDRRDFLTKADAFSEAAAICRKVQEGQDSLAWMHKAVTPDGEEYVDESGIPYSNKAMGAEHCVDDLLREEKKLRKQAEGHQ